MARRRLTPPASNVPHAEHSAEAPGPGSRPLAGLSSAMPIARVAADAAGAAALEEMSETLRKARETGRFVLDLPHGSIAADHLTRDRLPIEDAEMEALRASIRMHGQRSPIEVTPLAGTLPYGLISGWRRLAAIRTLHAETGEARFLTVQALVRRPAAVADAYVAMVEENEVRVGLSQYERARVAALAAARGVFPSEKAALLALFATASRPKRSRIRAFIEIYHALDGALRFPAHLPERLGLRLVDALRAGQAKVIVRALEQAAPGTPEAEQAALSAVLSPARKLRDEGASKERIRPDVTLEQAMKGETLTLRFRGHGVTPALAAEIRSLIDGLRRRD